jgi:hypothetical protein
MVVVGGAHKVVPEGAEMKARAVDHPLWQVRFTWEVIRGLPHPRYTYDRRFTESSAVNCAVFMRDNTARNADLRMVEAHVRGPGQEAWRLVEDDPPPW